MADRSTLRALFDRVERVIGGPLEQAVLTETFMDVLATAVRAGAGLQQAGLEVSAGILHRMNLPAYSDVLRIEAELRSLEASVRELTDALGEPRTVRRRAPRRAR